MAWNGVGTYVLDPSYSPETNGEIIDAARYNGLTSDIATGITQALNKNGENSPTANINWGGFKITNLAAPATAGDALRYGSAAAVGQLTLDSAGVSYGTWNGVNAMQSFWGLKAAGSFYGYLGTSEGTTGGAAGFGIRSETYLMFATGGANDRGRFLSTGELVIGATALAGIGTGSDKFAVNGTIGFTTKLHGISATFVELHNRHASGGLKFYVAAGGVLGMTIAADGLVLPQGCLQIPSAQALPDTVTGGQVLAYHGSSVSRLFFGDGSGYSWSLSKRNATVNTDLLTITDAGNITALGIGRVAVKTAATTRSATATPAADPHLGIAITATGYYEVELFLPLSVAVGGAANGFAYSLTYSGSIANDFQASYGFDDTLSSQGGLGFATGGSVASVSTGTNGWLMVKGVCQLTTTGSLSFNWSQAVSGAQNLTISIGAYMKVTKVG